MAAANFPPKKSRFFEELFQRRGGEESMRKGSVRWFVVPDTRILCLRGLGSVGSGGQGQKMKRNMVSCTEGETREKHPYFRGVVFGSVGRW